MSLLKRLKHDGHIRDEVGQMFRKYIDTGKILDIPSGDGVNAKNLVDSGFEVECADLFPDRARANGFTCTPCDMTAPLPYEDHSFEGVLHSEGIEHVDNQMSVLAELTRVLKPGGVLIVTTPNILFLSARVDTMLSGHPRPRRWLVTESHGYWGGSKTYGEDTYYGHVFLINAFQLRFYLTHVGLDVLGVEATRYSLNSILLAPLMFPLVWWGTRRMWRNRRFETSKSLKRSIQKEILSPALLFGPKLIMVARKPEE